MNVVTAILLVIMALGLDVIADVIGVSKQTRRRLEYVSIALASAGGAILTWWFLQ